MTEVTIMDALVNPEKVPHVVSFSFFASVVLVGAALFVRSTLKLVPTGFQNVIEAMVETLMNLSIDNLGHKWGKSILNSVIGTTFMYILFCNLMGLVPGFLSPTANINMTASMAVPVFLFTHIAGISIHRHHYLTHFLGPVRSIIALPLMILMFFIEFIGHIARPLTLSLRLFGNMQAKHIIMVVLATLSPVLVPVLILSLGVLVGLIQAFVFTLLATLYFAGAVEEAH